MTKFDSDGVVMDDTIIFSFIYHSYLLVLLRFVISLDSFNLIS